MFVVTSRGVTGSAEHPVRGRAGPPTPLPGGMQFRAHVTTPRVMVTQGGAGGAGRSGAFTSRNLEAPETLVQGEGARKPADAAESVLLQDPQLGAGPWAVGPAGGPRAVSQAVQGHFPGAATSCPHTETLLRVQHVTAPTWKRFLRLSVFKTICQSHYQVQYSQHEPLHGHHGKVGGSSRVGVCLHFPRHISAWTLSGVDLLSLGLK